jgi:hypothetical protein
MRTLLFLTLAAAASFPVAAQQQQQQTRSGQNTQNADVPETPKQEERVRVEGAAGGTKPPPPEARKGVGAGATPHVHDESSDRGMKRRVPDEVITPAK